MSFGYYFIQSRSMDDFDDSSTPEKRLWAAVILNSVQEYDDHLFVIRKLWDIDHKPVPKYYLGHLKALRYEMSHDWFRHVCDMADFNHSFIKGKLDSLDEKYRLDEVDFTNEESLITRYEIRGIKNRKERCRFKRSRYM